MIWQQVLYYSIVYIGIVLFLGNLDKLLYKVVFHTLGWKYILGTWLYLLAVILIPLAIISPHALTWSIISRILILDTLFTVGIYIMMNIMGLSARAAIGGEIGMTEKKFNELEAERLEKLSQKNNRKIRK